MAEVNLLQAKTSSKRKKKVFYISAAFVAVALVSGYFLFVRDSKDNEELAKEQMMKLVPDAWMLSYFGSLDDVVTGGVFGDPDEDGLTNYQEYTYQTSPLLSDTDGDGYSDGFEVVYSSDPLNRQIENVAAIAERQLKTVGIDISQKEIVDQLVVKFGEEREPRLSNFSKANLNASEDNSFKAIEKYVEEFSVKTYYFKSPTASLLFTTMFEGSSLVEITKFVVEQKKLVQSVLSMQVPSSLVDLHFSYLKTFDAFLGMGEFAMEEYKKMGIVDAGKFYPEMNYVLSIEPELARAKSEAYEKYKLAL